MLTIPREHDVIMDKFAFVQHNADAIVLGKIVTEPDSADIFAMHVYMPSQKMVRWLPLWTNEDGGQVRTASPSQGSTPVILHVHANKVEIMTELTGSKRNMLPKEAMDKLVNQGLISKITVAQEGVEIKIHMLTVDAISFETQPLPLKPLETSWLMYQTVQVYGIGSPASAFQKHYRMLYYLTKGEKLLTLTSEQVDQASDAADTFIKMLGMETQHPMGRVYQSRIAIMKLMVAIQSSLLHENPWACIAAGDTLVDATTSAWLRTLDQWSYSPDSMYLAYGKFT